MLRHVATLGVTLLCTATPVLADQFYVEDGNWTVLRLGAQSCLAVNRPPGEFNYAPYAGMTLHQRTSDQGPVVQVYFWPGAFTEGESVDLAFTPARGEPFEYLATAQTTYHVVGTEPMPADRLDAIATAGSVEISVVSSPLSGLMFETSDVAQVSAWLAQCVE